MGGYRVDETIIWKVAVRMVWIFHFLFAFNYIANQEDYARATEWDRVDEEEMRKINIRV